MTEFMILAAAVGGAGPPQFSPAKKTERGSPSESPFAGALEKERKKAPEEAELALAAQGMAAVQPAPPEQLSQPAQASEKADGEQPTAEPVQNTPTAGSEPTTVSGSSAPGASASGQQAAANSQPAAGGQPNQAGSQPGSKGQAAAQALSGVQPDALPEAQATAGQLPEAAQAAAAGLPQTAQGEGTAADSAQDCSAPIENPKTVKPRRTAAGEPAATVNGLNTADGEQKANTLNPVPALAGAQSKGNTQQPAEQANRAAAPNPKAQEEGKGDLKNAGVRLDAQDMSYGSLQKNQTIESSTIEPARLAEARNPQLVSQLSGGIQTLDKSGQTTLRLQLFPENLGKIDLRLTTGAGGLHVSLTADQPLTGTLLERHLPELIQALSDAGVNLGGLEINYGNSGQNPQEAWRWQASKSMRFAVPENELLADSPPVQRTRSGSGVDYRV